MREPRDDGPFPDFEGKTPAKRPPGGKPPCFIRIYFPRERFNFQIRPSAKVESEPFFDLQESKVESRFDFGQIRPPKRLSKTLFQRKSNLKVEFRFDFGKSRVLVFKTQPQTHIINDISTNIRFALDSRFWHLETGIGNPDSRLHSKLFARNLRPLLFAVC